jgi:hypothetical protein
MLISLCTDKPQHAITEARAPPRTRSLGSPPHIGFRTPAASAPGYCSARYDGAGPPYDCCKIGLLLRGVAPLICPPQRTLQREATCPCTLLRRRARLRRRGC